MGMKVNGTSGLTFPDTTTLASAGQASVRAWVNFNGTGTVAIRAAYNVTSITDNGTGQYTVNFTTAMPDANYAVSGTGGRPTSNTMAYVSTSNSASALTTTSVSVNVLSDAAVFRDASDIFIAIFR
jgi:hypothetical protein